jgi:hypothetical protein
MAPNLLLYQLLLVALVLICFIIHVWWPDDPRVTSQMLRKPDTPRRKTLHRAHTLYGLPPQTAVRSL